MSTSTELALGEQEAQAQAKMTHQAAIIPNIPTKATNPDLADPIVTETDHNIGSRDHHSHGHGTTGAGVPLAGAGSGVGAGHGLGTSSSTHTGTGTGTGLAGAGLAGAGGHAVRNDLDALPGEPKDERHIAHHPFAHTATEKGQKIMPVARDRSTTENEPLDVGAVKLPYGVTHTHDAGAAGRTMPDKSVHLATGEHQHKTDLNEKGKESIGAKIKHAVTGGGYELEK